MRKNAIKQFARAMLFVAAFGTGSAYADPVISAIVGKTSASVNDLVTVKIAVSGNTGMHGAYFDLGFDAGAFAFVSLSESTLPLKVNASNPDASRVLYAVSDETTSATLGHHLIVSYVVSASDGMVSENGTLVEAVFRVIGGGKPSAQRFAFAAAGSGAMGLAGTKLLQTKFVDSSEITIDAKSGAYVQINAPKANEAVYTDTVSLSATSTAGAGYTYVVSNKDNSFVSAPVSAQSGYLTAYPVSVAYGINRLSISLRDDKGATVATDTKTILRSEGDAFVKIVSPSDHALVNTDMVRVLVASPLGSMSVNGKACSLLAEKSSGKNLFEAKIWLKRGFNELKAETVGPQGIKFADSVTVFYQRDDNLFRFVDPDADSVVKTVGDDPQLVNGNLIVRGEIGSRIKEDGNPNTVSLRVVYTPNNPALNSRVLVRDLQMTVSETTLSSGDAEAPYMFANAFAIPVAGLASGELEIIAYKNKSGSASESEIHRTVRLDSNELSINIVQPNVFGEDILDSEQKFKDFNGLTAPDWKGGRVQLLSGATIGLAAVNSEIRSQTGLGGSALECVIKAKDGSLYALANRNNVMRMYRRAANEQSWSLAFTRDDMHGYTMCETDVGMLIGVSNLSSSGNSGLYLYANGALKNVVIGQPISHVQFIEYRDGTVYLYGNSYSYLYSFNAFSLVETQTLYTADSVSKIPFENSLFLRRFTLGKDAKTALALDNDGVLHVYQNLYGTGFECVNFDSGVFPSTMRFQAIVPGPYSQGDYRSYLLIPSSGEASTRVLMENKGTNRLIMAASLDETAIAGESLIGAGFADDRYQLLYKKVESGTISYTIRQAKVFFNTLAFDAVDPFLVFPGSVDIVPGAANGFGLLPCGDGSYLFGYDCATENPICCEFLKNYPASGELRFDYRNPDAENINGFSFLVDSSLLSEGSTLIPGIRVGFELRETDSGAVVTGTSGGTGSAPSALPIRDFLKSGNALYKVSRQYDSESGKDLVTVTFTNPSPNRYLAFRVGLDSVGGKTRSISSLTVQKKMTAKVPRSGTEKTILPISGWVYDSSATEIQIQEKNVPIESGGYFVSLYELNTAQKTSAINLSCTNTSGETAKVSFTAEIIESLVSLDVDGLKSGNETLSPSDDDGNEFSTTKGSVEVSASYSGMEGVVVGFETYAYVYVDGKETLERLSSGVFTPKSQVSAEPGYVSGTIAGESIPLYPGKQRLVVYAENPGGKRAEYTVGGEFPDIVYNLPESEQKITILNPDVVSLSASKTVSGVTVDKQADVVLHESSSSPYVYSRNYTVSGRIVSLYRFTDLRVKSDNRAMRFSDGSQETTVSVDELNRFEVTVTITMPESDDTGAYALLFVPSSPFLNAMKTGVMINAVKDYSGACIVPNFSPMNSANWTSAELTAREKPIRVKIARHVPAGATMALTVNYETAINGILSEITGSSGTYRLLDEQRNELKLKGLKNGVNRVQWELARNATVSSSAEQSRGMKDYTLEIEFPDVKQPTVLDFPIDETVYYGKDAATQLPGFAVTKQQNTSILVYLNGSLVLADSAKASCAVDLAKCASLRQGRNYVRFEYTEPGASTVTKSCEFLYDNLVPSVSITGFEYVKGNSPRHLASLSAIVKEANIRKVELLEKKNGVESLVGTTELYSVTDLGAQTYRVDWSSLETNTPVLCPSSKDFLFARVTDYAGHSNVSDPFEGVSTLPGNETIAVNQIDVGSAEYVGTPGFNDGSANWGPSPFARRVKIYCADIAYPDLQAPGAGKALTLNRSGNVTIGKVSGSGGTITVNSGTGVSFPKGFSLPKNTVLSVTKPVVNVDVNPVSKRLQFKKTEKSTQLSISFWFRYEGKTSYKADDQASDPEKYRKILTLAKGTIGSTTDYEVYLAYAEGDHATLGDEKLYVIEWSGTKDGVNSWIGQKYTKLLDAGVSNAATLSRAGTDTAASPGSDGWNMVTISVDVATASDGTLSPLYRLSVNDNMPVQALHYADINGYEAPGGTTIPDYLAHLREQMLGANAVFTFGNDNGTADIDGNASSDRTARNGHFSIARPFFTNKAITNQDVSSLVETLGSEYATETGSLIGDMSSKFDFTEEGASGATPTVSSYGPGFTQLEPIGSISDYFTELENADYSASSISTAATKYGALRASGLKVNRLKLEKGKLMFRDAASAVADKLDVSEPDPLSADGWISMSPKGNLQPGRYSFSNNYSAHTIVNDKWYSVYGKVALGDRATTMDAKLVISVNGVERTYAMEPGDFHFVYENTANVAPSKVVMYIETTTSIRLSKCMFFTEGNYRLPDEAFAGLNQSAAITSFIFQKSGTVEFWYKPMIASEDGYVDYPVTIFDSEFVSVGGAVGSDKHANFYATLKGTPVSGSSTDNFKLEGTIPVRAGWQHIQFSWNMSGTEKIACLYVDGRIVAKTEKDSELRYSPTMRGFGPSGRNVSLGANIDRTEWANGYLDEVRIDSLYDESRYENRSPITALYDDGFDPSGVPDPRISLTANLGGQSVNSVSTTLYETTGAKAYEASGTDIKSVVPDISRFLAGPYTLKTAASVNGHRFDDIYRFVKNDRPRIVLTDRTAMMVGNEPTNLTFDFQYDSSYLLEEMLFHRYAGLELVVAGSKDSVPFERRYYAVQDYKTFDHTGKWILFTPSSGELYEDLPVENNRFTVNVPGLVSDGEVTWSYRTFYFSNIFDAGKPPVGSALDGGSGSIPFAEMSVEIMPTTVSGIRYEYKLDLSLKRGGSAEVSNASDFTVTYSAYDSKGTLVNAVSDPIAFAPDGNMSLYYDDVLKGAGTGAFTVDLTLKYKNSSIQTKTMALNYKYVEKNETQREDRRLCVEELSLLSISTTGSGDTAELYLEFDQNGLLSGSIESVSLFYDVTVLKKNQDGSYTTVMSREREPIGDYSLGYEIITGVAIPKGDALVRVSLYDQTVRNGVAYTELTSDKELALNNKIDPPRVVLTNSVPSRIGYNNVRFSWTGYYKDVFDPKIRFSYNFDDKGWSSISPDWRSVEYYNLAEGSHRFRVRAHYGDDENVSPEAVSIFYVDVNRPVFSTAADAISVQKLLDDDGFPYAVVIKGSSGAISDSSLTSVVINGEAAKFDRKDGSFSSAELPIVADGDNEYVITAYDSVGNYTKKTITVPNAITTIVYPTSGTAVRYAPVTLVGKLSQGVNRRVSIYVKDPLVPGAAGGDYSSWRKARINEDFTFFVEDIAVNPGTKSRSANTALEMAVVSDSGRTYTRTIELTANEVTRPIDLTLSSHAVEGESADTEVTISAKANVSNISSWSVDYTGDGIYDDVAIMDDPSTAQSYSWKHVYSTLGKLAPRVRVITKDGLYFSVSDSLIIHEEIQEASNKGILNPISLASLSMADGSQRIYALAGKSGSYRIEAYEIGRNETYVSNKLYQVALSGMGIENPVKIAAVSPKVLLIAENRDGKGTVHTVQADEYDAYSPVNSAKVSLDDEISDIDCDGKALYVTCGNGNALYVAAMANGIPDPSTLGKKEVESLAEDPLGSRMGVAKDAYGILLADYDHQRVVRVSDTYKMLEYMGEQGTGEGQFIKPSLVKSYQNRMFVYDEARCDVQFFDPNFTPITRLAYDAAKGDKNCLDENFLKGVVGISVFTRQESERLFYYAVLLSKTSNKLSVFRMPQWEELRATVRNNRIIFLKDNEVYSATPAGGDFKKLLSSDSIPRISGSIDYPALSPDGKSIAFTSRAKLYDGSGLTTSGTAYAYDNLYIMGIGGDNLTRIPLDAIARYEIERPQFNSNGTQLAFSAKPTGGKWQIYLYTFATGAVQRLFASDENARFPYFSPDDRFVAFTTDYDGDEEIQIYDTLNPTMRVSVTKNGCRDSYPVWSAVYPGEIANPDLKIESKISFVSERNSHKALYTAYLSRKSDADIRVVKKTGAETGGTPDVAAVEITGTGMEGDYPCFTGDGTKVIYERYDGAQDNIVGYDYETGATGAIKQLAGCRHPAGMKNAIACFSAAVENGNTIHLKWNRYTDNDVFYTVHFRTGQDGSTEVEKRVFTQDEAYLTGLEMGMDYLVRISIDENGLEAASTQWKKVKMPEVVARPSYKIDASNPYLVHLYAWTPTDETDWGFSWIIDNQEIAVQGSGYYPYEFSTSGTKTITLKAHNKANTYTSVSEPMSVKIVSDIKPAIEYVLADDRTGVTLSATGSVGSKIDWSTAAWTITGPGMAVPIATTGLTPYVDISGLHQKMNVNLKLSRYHVNNQTNTDTIEKNLLIDLKYTGTKIVITQETDSANERLITFSGSNSIGNLNWREARWTVFKDGQALYQTSGVSSCAYEFPETNADARYSVSLGVPSKSDGTTYTANNIVTVGSSPIEPEVDYEIVLMKDSLGNAQGAKIIFSATNSKGSNIDYAQAKWTVPVAGVYGEEPTQVGPTAVYNLMNVGSSTQVEVSLTLMRRGGTESITATKVISIDASNVAKPELVVKRTKTDAESGTVVELNVLSSTGPNIDWEKTTWQFSNTINGAAQVSTQQGPTARIEVPASSEDTVLRYTVTMRFTGSSAPIVKNEELRLSAKTIKPLIAPKRLSGGNGNVYTFSVSDTSGVNIDWDKTTWYFYDGNATVTPVYGSQVTHAFVRKSSAMGYPVVVAMYFKGTSKPFYGYTSVDIEGDLLVPVISWDRAEAKSGSETLFTADQSTGSGIDWSQAKWSFGDGSASQYGASVGHQYAASDQNEEYKVSLTLVRTLANGSTETATASTTVNVGKDEVKPVIKAKLYRDGYLVLTSEESQGRGLLLNQSGWMFAGKGDSENTSINKQTGTTSGTTSTMGFETGISGTTGTGHNFPIIDTVTISASLSGSKQSQDTSSDSLSSGDTFSNENYHVGMTARRWIGNYDIYAAKYDTQKYITVTLNVYRVDADGSMTGKTITVNVNLADAVSGVTYK